MTAANRYEVSFEDDKNALGLVVMVAQLCVYTENLLIIYFKRMTIL